MKTSSAKKFGSYLAVFAVLIAAFLVFSDGSSRGLSLQTSSAQSTTCSGEHKSQKKAINNFNSDCDGYEFDTCSKINKTWVCSGTLQTNPPVNGVCGSGNNTTQQSEPTGSSACSSGQFTNKTDSADKFLWSCNGQNGGTSSNCSANKVISPTPVNGLCGEADGSAVTSMPAGTQACAQGTIANTDETLAEYTWDCQGSDGGSAASCSAAITPSTYCGADNGQTLSSSPTNTLCANGTTPTDQTGSGPWEWACTESGGAIVETCKALSANEPALVTGQCGASIDSCTAGTFVTAADSSSQNIWGCIGSGGYDSFAMCAISK